MLEELLLPTFVWQQHPELAMSEKAVPTMVMRAWANAKGRVAQKAIERLLSETNRTGFLADRPHVCGIKVPRNSIADELLHKRLNASVLALSDLL